MLGRHPKPSETAHDVIMVTSVRPQVTPSFCFGGTDDQATAHLTSWLVRCSSSFVTRHRRHQLLTGP